MMPTGFGSSAGVKHTANVALSTFYGGGIREILFKVLNDSYEILPK